MSLNLGWPGYLAVPVSKLSFKFKNLENWQISIFLLGGYFNFKTHSCLSYLPSNNLSKKFRKKYGVKRPYVHMHMYDLTYVLNFTVFFVGYAS